eukprot:15445219-Alexandrium_andersonii.AAC.1
MFGRLFAQAAERAAVRLPRHVGVLVKGGRPCGASEPQGVQGPSAAGCGHVCRWEAVRAPRHAWAVLA